MPWIDRFGLSVVLHLLDRLQQLRQAFEREELALQRHQDRIRCGHRIDREQIERRRAVDQHIGVVAIVSGIAVQRGDRIAQTEGAAGGGAELKLEAGEIHGGGRDVQPRDCGRHHRFAQGCFADQHVIGRAAAVAAVDAEAGRGVALGIEVDDQDALADRSQRRAEVDCSRGLADAALLVGERQDARMAAPRLRRRILLKYLTIFGHGGCPAGPAEGYARSIRSSSTIQPFPPVRLE